MNVIFSEGYAPAEAERGKFTVIDPTTITNLPSSSRGRYAVLTYNIGSDTSAIVLSGGLPNTTTEELLTFSANDSASLTFNPAINLLEISNRSDGSVYLTYAIPPTTDFETLTSCGLEIAKGSFYSIDRTTTTITMGSVAGGNVVVFGHYKA